MIWDTYKDQIANLADSAKELIPMDLNLEVTKSWLLTTGDGKNIVELQTILSADFTNESNVVASIIENGSFVSYNKVDLPVQIVLTVVLDGLRYQQQESIETLRKFKSSTDLLQVITPFETYENMNLTGLRYSRTVERGAMQTVIDLVLQEVRQVNVQVDTTQPMASASLVKNASVVKPANVGKVDAQTLAEKGKNAVSKALRKVNDFIGVDA